MTFTVHVLYLEVFPFLLVHFLTNTGLPFRTVEAKLVERQLPARFSERLKQALVNSGPLELGPQKTPSLSEETVTSLSSADNNPLQPFAKMLSVGIAFRVVR